MSNSVKKGLEQDEQNAVMTINVDAKKAQPKKKQAKSASYALKAFKEHAKTLIENGLIDKDDEIELRQILERAILKHAEKEYGL